MSVLDSGPAVAGSLQSKNLNGQLANLKDAREGLNER
jgi:hypothetical protein